VSFGGGAIRVRDQRDCRLRALDPDDVAIGVVEGRAMPDHIHMLLSVPPRYSIAMTIGYFKGKSATRIHRELLHTKGTLFGRGFWARGYCVSTVGLDEVQIRRYIREQEKLQGSQPHPCENLR
jgi:putative transposase